MRKGRRKEDLHLRLLEGLLLVVDAVPGLLLVALLGALVALVLVDDAHVGGGEGVEDLLDELRGPVVEEVLKGG